MRWCASCPFRTTHIEYTAMFNVRWSPLFIRVKHAFVSSDRSDTATHIIKKCPVFVSVCLSTAFCSMSIVHPPHTSHSAPATCFVLHSTSQKTKRTSKTWNIKQQRLLLLRVLLLYQPEIMLNNPIHSSI